MKKLLIVLVILVFSGCSSDSENTPDIIDGPIISISTNTNSIPDDSRVFYSVKGEGGADIAYGELANSNTIIIEDDNYNGRRIALTFYVPGSPSVFQNITSYLDIERGKTFTFRNLRLRDVPQASTSIKFSGFEGFESIRITEPGTNRSYLSGSVDESDIDFFDGYPSFLIASPSRNEFQYQVLNFEPGVLRTISSSDNKGFENEHNIVSNVKSSEELLYDISLEAETEVYENGSNSVLVYSSGGIEVNANSALKVYSPSIEQFIKYELSITTSFNNAIYSQNTEGIPSSIEFIDPEIKVVDDAFESPDIRAEGDQVTYIQSSWFSGSWPWFIYNSPNSTTNNFSLNEIPAEIIAEINGLGDISSPRLGSVSASRLDDFNYDKGIEDLFNPDIKASVILRKRMNLN